MLRESVADEVFSAVARATRLDVSREELDLDLFELPLLDSFAVVELLVYLSDRLQVDLSPSEFDRERWATPRKIIAYLECRLAPPAAG